MPLVRNRELVTFSMLTGEDVGAPATNEIPNSLHVLDISVYQEINKIPIATIRIADGSAAEGDFSVSNSGKFSPGKSIEIQLGYNSENITVFKGIIVSNAHVLNGRQTTLNITCKHETVKMTVSKKNRHFNDLKDHEVVETLLQENGIGDSDVPVFGSMHPQLLQVNVSDWDYMLSRLDSVGQACSIDDGGFKVFSPDPSDDPVMTLTFGENMLAFRTESDMRSQSTSVKAFSWDYANQAVNEAEAAAVNGAAPGNISEGELADAGGQAFEIKTPVFMDNEALQSLANAKKLKQSLSKIKGKVKFQGNSGVKPGNWIEITGVGEQFSGKAFVSAVRHEYQNGNWISEATLGWEESFFTEKFNPHAVSSESGRFSRVQGLQIGIVTDIVDPLGEGRVRVRLPMVNENDAGLFARVATLDAGSNRGTFFRPEIGDEVILGFLHGDPDHPVILGMLHSSAKPTPFDPEEANDEKGYVSRSEVKITINDGDKSLTLETPGGRIFTLNDSSGIISLKDGSGNVLKMDSSGIELESPKSITLKAGTDLLLSGLQLGISASQSASFEGSGGITLKSSGTTELNGAMVEITGSLVKIN